MFRRWYHCKTQEKKIVQEFTMIQNQHLFGEFISTAEQKHVGMRYSV